MHGLGSQRMYHSVVGLVLVGGLLGSSADSGLGSLLGGLLGTGGSSTATSTTVQPGGTLRADDQKLRKGCKRYSYHYAITVPDGDDFDLEILVTDPRGISQGSDVILSGADPLSGTKSLTICRSNTVPGRFILHGTLDTSDGADPTTTTVLRSDTFKLTVPKKHKHKHKHRKHKKGHH